MADHNAAAAAEYRMMMQCVRASSVADGFAVPILPDWFTSRQDDFDYDTVIYVVRVHILSALA